MTTAQRLHYSRDHWEKQYNDCLKNSRAYEARVKRLPWREPLSERVVEVLASCRDRIKYAYVNGCAMATDPLRLDGVSFGRMLDDAKRQLRAEIDRKAKDLEHVEKLKHEVTKMFFSMYETQMYYRYVSASSFAGRHFYGLDLGEGRDTTVVRQVYYQPGRRAGKTFDHSQDAARYLEKGDDVLDHYDALLDMRERWGRADTWVERQVRKLKRIFHTNHKSK